MNNVATPKPGRFHEELAKLDLAPIVMRGRADLDAGSVEGTTEPAEEGTSTLEPPSAFMEMNRNLLESSSSSDSKNEKKNRRHCQNTFFWNVAHRKVGISSQRPRE